MKIDKVVLNLPEKIILFDLEYTSWEGSMARDWSGEGEYREIVDIGAIRFNTKTGAEESRFQRFVKPKKNPKLSDYFIKLTRITQANVDRKGVSFEQALEEFREWSGNYPIYSFGSDGKTLKENCGLYGVAWPFQDGRFFDVREIFKNAGIVTENYMSSTIIEAFGQKSKHRGHTGLNDVRTIADALRILIGV
ncbi:MAG: hypothetical protein A2836_00100 [Candidatus Taylorbacteria bacterium RIFCSPHIGHO2_01_FULL_45_63]|uniref:Exonuclease domain-containing protein n=1 Tax=Candidatus Taylorbacteria bacterium RIFCSPHIGHO2_02_FULL_45_35 TaxID=1802311 RepID=A0A1G2MVA0_9BACT|nr:MAG: hypothetical protein A2836_00100 [Candidatus Taylorbacteria bacterium RIFCSPHIGHO2_01_FULL_45_63]OHA27199.1 MAG: hypothetical protein A3D56_01955 [Candidatus Taylorbacteria bacterium RIFCSPHIGHO2_02_FULL_45_35]OHA33693.1 MAG: hypothetical protein A3A22_03890 [Candidatus Taylorbacteria bacterium RIFCSPLOWO2_01_FULL_45_34b]